MGLINSPYVGSVEQGRKPQRTLCVSMKPWLHTDIPIWAPFCWTQRMSEV